MKLFRNTFTVTVFLAGTALLSCGSSPKNQTQAEETTVQATDVQIPVFNADSAFAYVKAQTDFSPRVPNSAAHRACGDYLAGQLENSAQKSTISKPT